jgi:hypothetical protein
VFDSEFLLVRFFRVLLFASVSEQSFLVFQRGNTALEEAPHERDDLGEQNGSECGILKHGEIAHEHLQLLIVI